MTYKNIFPLITKAVLLKANGIIDTNSSHNSFNLSKYIANVYYLLWQHKAEVIISLNKTNHRRVLKCVSNFRRKKDLIDFSFISFFTSWIRHQQMCLYVCIFPKALRRMLCENYLFHSQSCCYLVTFQSTERKKEGGELKAQQNRLNYFKLQWCCNP